MKENGFSNKEMPHQCKDIVLNFDSFKNYKLISLVNHTTKMNKTESK